MSARPHILTLLVEELRRSQITVVDLTGVAVQDIQITKAVWKVAGPK